MNNNEDLEKTIDLAALVDIEENTDKEEVIEVLEEDKKEKKKKSIKKWWNSLTKKKKIIYICILVILVIAIVVGIIFLVKKNKNIEEDIVEEEVVIIEQDNFRYEDGKLYFLNASKDEVGTYECQNKNENLCFVAYYSDEDDFDVVKKVNEDNELIKLRTPIILEKYAFIFDNKSENDETIKLYNFVDDKEEGTYYLVKKAEDNNFILKDNLGEYGILSISDDISTKLDFKYDYLAYYYPSDNYLSKQNGRYIIINNSGKTLSKGINGDIKGWNNNYIKYIDSNKSYTLVDYNGNTLFNNYDYMDLYEEFVILINNNQMELKLYDGSKLIEDKIILKDNNYNKSSIFDENGKLIETILPYQVEENDNTININTNNSLTKINKLDAKVSRNIKYINYFNGKLYFYADEKKDNLIGSYECINKNNLNSETDTLNNCYIASDTSFEDNDIELVKSSGVIPLFNNQFVFVFDNPDLVNDTNKLVVLYDLKNNKNISKYSEVNTYSNTNLNEISFKNTGDLLVVAKNTSNKFGMIKITSSEVKSVMPFNYNNIERIGNYYSVIENNKSYLVDNTGLKKTELVPGKIRNYNAKYVTVNDNNKYYVYDYNGQKISEGFKYISLYDNFYAAVLDSNKLELYTYDSKENKLTEDIMLNLENYYGNGTLAFKIDTNGYYYTISVGTSSDTYEIKASGSIMEGVE